MVRGLLDQICSDWNPNYMTAYGSVNLVIAGTLRKIHNYIIYIYILVLFLGL